MVKLTFLSGLLPLSFVWSATCAPTNSSVQAQAVVEGVEANEFTNNLADWKNLKGVGFAYVMATAEPAALMNPFFTSQTNGALGAGLITGAYHTGKPNVPGSSAADQAAYFVRRGGAWKADGKTLPGALYIPCEPISSFLAKSSPADGLCAEVGDNQARCYGLTTTAMVQWIKTFIDTYKSSTTRTPVIRTSADWWKTCTGNDVSIAKAGAPLWLINWGSSPGPIPGGWKSITFWQYTNKGAGVLNFRDVFHGDLKALKKFAKGA
ncbi:hypothetical protein FRB99_002160 [Tulasnella sp. 403]|nr:hypothetical protein FRB99_002160 [Tulasnella sp. 403]